VTIKDISKATRLKKISDKDCLVQKDKKKRIYFIQV